MGKHIRGDFSTEEIRNRVDGVVGSWRSYPDFAEFFKRLLQANNISEKTFAKQYSETVGNKLSTTKVFGISSGTNEPSYQFVVDIADHALLSLDPNRLLPANADQAAGDQRIALFTAAGLIEVTPESIKQWNEDVIAGWQNRKAIEQSRPTWQELMRKLFSFHQQGRRCLTADLAKAATALLEPSNQIDEMRLAVLLAGRGVPSEFERKALGKVAGLTDGQLDQIEAAVDDGTLPLSPRAFPSRFSKHFSEIVERLWSFDISNRELESKSILIGQTEPLFSSVTVSSWKSGKARPTLSAFRGLIVSLERCFDKAGARIVADDEINSLIAEAGFTSKELTATTHDFIAEIDDKTRIKPLLASLRNAVDLNVIMSAVDDPDLKASLGVPSNDLLSMMKHWENEASPTFPTNVEVHDLLARYNYLLRAKGEPELNADEIQRVADLAQRERDEVQRQGFLKKAISQRPQASRRILSPDIGEVPSR